MHIGPVHFEANLEISIMQILTPRLDWLQADEIVEDASDCENTTLLWNLNTSNVSEHSISFLCTVGRSVMKDSVSDSGFILLNERFQYHCSHWIKIFARFLLRYLSGLFSYQSEPKFATRLQVFERKSLEDNSVQLWVVEVNQIEVGDHILSRERFTEKRKKPNKC